MTITIQCDLCGLFYVKDKTIFNTIEQVGEVCPTCYNDLKDSDLFEDLIIAHSEKQFENHQ